MVDQLKDLIVVPSNGMQFTSEKHVDGCLQFLNLSMDVEGGLWWKYMANLREGSASSF